LARSTPRRAAPGPKSGGGGAPARRTIRVGGGGATILSAAAARRDRLRALLSNTEALVMRFTLIRFRIDYMDLLARKLNKPQLLYSLFEGQLLFELVVVHFNCI